MHATSSGPSTTRCGERPRTTRSGCFGRSRARPLNGRPRIRPFRRRTTSPSATWTRPGAPGTRGGPARSPISTAAPSPTSRLNSPCISRCPSTLAGWACWRATTARRHRTLACRSSASGSCTRRATSTSTSLPRAGRRKATRSWCGPMRPSSRCPGPTAGPASSRCRSATARCAWRCGGCGLGASTCTCSTPIWRGTRRGTASCRHASMAATARRGCSRRSSWASAASACCARWGCHRPCTTSTKATPPSSSFNASASSSTAGTTSTRPSPKCAARPFSRRTRRCRPDMTRSPFTWSSGTWPVAGARSANTVRASWRSASTTTGAERSST